MRELLDDLRALDALFSDESKWTRGMMLDESASCCVIQGVVRVTAQKGFALRDKRQQDCLEALRSGLPEKYQGESPLGNPVALWAERPERTFADVKALIRAAIEREERNP